MARARFRLALGLFVLLPFGSGSVFAEPAPVGRQQQIPTAFVANQGQFDARARFVARHGGMTAFFLADRVAMSLAPRSGGNTGVNLFFDFEGASPDAAVEGVGAVNGVFNYFIGDDPASWRTDVPGYAGVRYRGMYPGVDVSFRHEAGSLEYDLLCEHASDVSRVAIAVEGAKSLAVDPDGRLAIETAAGVLHQDRPYVFALGDDGTRTPIDCRLVLLGPNRFGFAVDAARHDGRILVDPALQYSTYLGGGSDDVVHGIAVDGNGETFLTGSTESTNFPVQAGAFDTSVGFTDAFLVKLNGAGTGTFFATYFGGGPTIDVATAVALDSTGQIFIVGSAQATVFGSTFPTTPGAFDTVHSGGTNIDGFVAKFNAAGNSLVYSSFLGESWTVVDGVAAGPGDTAYVTGFTFTPAFPVTAGAFDTTFTMGFFASDAFVTHFNASGSALLYSSFFGASASEVGQDIVVDGAGNAYVVGSAGAPGLAGTPGVIDPTVSGAFVLGVNPSGSAIVFSTGLGSAYEATGVALSGNDLIVTGYTFSSVLTTPTAFDTTFNGGTDDAFVVKINNTGTVLKYGTYLGGSGSDRGEDVAVDARGNAHVSGGTTSANFPTTPGGPQQAANGGNDAFVAKLDPKGEVLLYGTYLGGSGTEFLTASGGAVLAPSAIAVDAAEASYVAGFTDSTNFPTTAGALDTSANGAEDGFVAKAVTRTCGGNATSSTYGSGKPGTNGVPVLDSVNLPYVGATTSVRVTNGKPFTPSAIFLGLAPAALPFDGGTLLVTPTLVVNLPPFDASGTLTITATLGDSPSLCGIAIYHQVVFADPGATGFYHTAQSNGLVRTLGS